jgi:hypothetical protein
MKNFFKLCDGINTIPLLLVIQQNPQLWDQNTLRTTHPYTPHSQVHDIWLRFNDTSVLEEKGETGRKEFLDQHESIDYPSFDKLYEARIMTNQLMAQVQGQRLGRVMITKLEPGKKIDAHVDSGDHAAYYERFHIVLQSAPGVIFRAGDEKVYMKTGECWWFQNQVEHEVINNSVSDRLHMIVDIHTGRGFK